MNHMGPKSKILLDTDIGSDIDDAVCLAYLLAQPACDLLGITTVTGQAPQRAQIASALCRAAGKDIPIYPGIEAPLLVNPRQVEAQQAAALGNWPHEVDFPRGEAVEFLRRTIRAHPGEITLLTIGPLTNIGLLFALDEDIPALLKGLVMMGGLFGSARSPQRLEEWNLLLDPHAAEIVFRRSVPDLKAVGVDVTSRVSLPAFEVQQRFQAPLLQPVLDFAQVWFEEGNQNLTFHDPLAAVTLFTEDVCSFGRGEIHLDLTNPEHAGITRFEPDPKGKHQIALDVDPERFFEHFFSVF
jgi:inosine-uridine nucleoside N-ribohydrolase